MEEQKSSGLTLRRNYPEISNIGIHTGRYNSVARDSDGTFLVPMGCQLRRWKVSRELFEWTDVERITTDIVMSLLENSRVFVATSYHGQAVFFKKRGEKLGEETDMNTHFEILASVQTKG